MKEQITESFVANEIRMLSSEHSGSFLVVEGPTDSKLYGRFVNKRLCWVVIAHNRKNLIEALKILEQEGFKNILAIKDADFDILERRKQKSENIVLTDTHDLETLLIKSKAFDCVLVTLGSSEKIKHFLEGKCRKPNALRKYLLKCCIELGYLRWVSEKGGLRLKFKDLNYKKFIDKNTLQVDLDKLIRIVKDRTDNICISVSAIKEKVETLKINKHDPWLVCNGKDAVNVLREGLCFCIGSKNKNTFTSESLTESLCLAFHQSDFKNTSLYNSIKKWESKNKPYKVLSKRK